MASHTRERHRFMIMKSFRRELRLWVLILLGYLCQVCIVPYLRMGRVTPMLTMSVIAIITVTYGRQRAFWCGAVYGILYEVMLPSHEMFQLLLYPASAMVGMILFPDKSMQQLEYERSIGKPGRNRSPHLRTVLCTMVDTLVYEMVQIVYVYLRESVISMDFIVTGLEIILYSTILTLLIMIPVRRFLGYRYERQKALPPKKYDIGSERILT